MSPKGTIYSGENSRRLLVPQALVAALTALLDDLEPERPTYAWAELRTLRSRLCRLYKLEDPAGRANEVDIEQELAEQDGEAIEDAP